MFRGKRLSGGERVRILRAMKLGEDDLPRTGASARTLGARCNIDIPTSEDGFVEPGTDGMSVSPYPPENLPPHRRPPEFGGEGKDPLWELETDELPEELRYGTDPDRPEEHGFIEPSRRMPFEEYQRAIHGTRGLWTPMG
jgi:hypothetical protein